MGKAFTEKERIELQASLRQIGLQLFAEKGIKGVSIRALTAKAGIAQGGFYNFYKDKEDFLLDLIAFRVNDKLALRLEHIEETLSDPVGYVIELFFQEGMHLKKNKAFDNMISSSMEFFSSNKNEISSRISKLYIEFFESLFAYWKVNGFCVKMDLNGLINLFFAAFILFSNASLLDNNYFETIYRTFCVSEVNAFLEVRK